MIGKEFWRRSMTHVEVNLTSEKIDALHRFFRLRGIAILLTGSLAAMNGNAQQFANSYVCVGEGINLPARIDTPSMYDQSTYLGKVRLIDSPLGNHLVLGVDGMTDGQRSSSLILPNVLLGDLKSVEVKGMFITSYTGPLSIHSLGRMKGPNEVFPSPTKVFPSNTYTPVTCQASYESEPETRKPPY